MWQELTGKALQCCLAGWSVDWLVGLVSYCRRCLLVDMAMLAIKMQLKCECGEMWCVCRLHVCKRCCYYSCWVVLIFCFCLLICLFVLCCTAFFCLLLFDFITSVHVGGLAPTQSCVKKERSSTKKVKKNKSNNNKI